jgi:hypothetical protein
MQNRLLFLFLGFGLSRNAYLHCFASLTVRAQNITLQVCIVLFGGVVRFHERPVRDGLQADDQNAEQIGDKHERLVLRVT